MGGIGKTQLAVEYVHRNRDDYPGGIFWIDASAPLAEGFSRLATDGRLKWAEPDRPCDEQIRAAFAALNRRADGLLVLDNLPDPATIAIPVLPGCTPEDLKCRLLFTTRRHDLGRFTGVEVTVLPEEPALRLLLRHPSRKGTLEPADPDHEHARAIARMLGRLPLALELAGAYLGKFSGDVTLEGYRDGLRSDGALATLDADAAEVSEADLRRVHDPAVAATIGEQWEALGDDSARLLLRVGSLFQESAALPVVRLGLLAGLGDDAHPGRPSPLRRAIRRLHDACLIERLEGDQLRLHPLIREFALRKTPPDQAEEFLASRIEEASEALDSFDTLEMLDRQRGIDGLQWDIMAILALCPSSANAPGRRLRGVLRLLQRESHNLRGWDRSVSSSTFAQQMHFRSVSIGNMPLASKAEHRLMELARPGFILRWRTSSESPALVRILTGHQAGVNSVTVSPDGRLIASASDDQTVAVWDLHSGKRQHELVGHRANVNSVAFSPDGRFIISSSSDCVVIWNGLSGDSLRQVSGHGAGITYASVSPDGRRIASASVDGSVCVWDFESGARLGELKGHAGWVNSVAFGPDGRRIVSGSSDRTVAVWDSTSVDLLRRFTGQQARINSVAFSPDGRQVASGSKKNLAVWNVESGSPVLQVSRHRGGVECVAFSPNGRYIVAASRKSLEAWDIGSGARLLRFTGHLGGVNSVSFSSDGRHMVSGSEDRTVAIWDVESASPIDRQTGNCGRVNALAISPDGRYVVSASLDPALAIWDLEKGVKIGELIGHQDRVNSVAYSPDGRRLVSGSSDQTIVLWDMESRAPIRWLSGHQNWVNSVAFSTNGQRLVSGSSDRSIALWDLESGTPLHRFSGHTGWVTSVAFSSDGRFVASGSLDRSVGVWDVEHGTRIRFLTGHRGWAMSVAFSPDGRQVVSTSDDNTLAVWDIESGSTTHCLTGHQGRVNSVALSPEGHRVASGSADRTIAVWDLHSGHLLARLALDGMIRCVAWGRDGRVLTAADTSGNLYCLEYREY
jgi:WD40 repeat protein